jgi:hypothetical protein
MARRSACRSRTVGPHDLPIVVPRAARSLSRRTARRAGMGSSSKKRASRNGVTGGSTNKVASRRLLDTLGASLPEPPFGGTRLGGDAPPSAATMRRPDQGVNPTRWIGGPRRPFSSRRGVAATMGSQMLISEGAGTLEKCEEGPISRNGPSSREERAIRDRRPSGRSPLVATVAKFTPIVITECHARPRANARREGARPPFSCALARSRPARSSSPRS